MFVKNGIAYAGEPVQGIRVNRVDSLGNAMLLITFSTGETRLYDASQLFDIPAFSQLQDERTLASCSIEHGIPTWCNGAIDIAPETLYSTSFAYQKIA